LAVVLMVVAVLATIIGYSWALSKTKVEYLKQLKDQGDAINKRAQDQLQNWKSQELNIIRQQIYDAAKGQAIQETRDQMQKWQENELQQARQQMLEGARGEAIKGAQEQLVKWRTEELEKAKSQLWEVLNKEANVSLEHWKVDAEREIRRDAIDKSQSVTMGKMTEHIIPYLPGLGLTHPTHDLSEAQ